MTTKSGRKGGEPGKGNPGGERGGNRAGGDKPPPGPSKSSQSAGADPRRGQPG
jgi:hypothetical protein